MQFLSQARLYFKGPAAVGLLFLRLFAGLALASHGQGKIAHPFDWMGPSGPPAILQALAALSEFGGGIALIFGLFTPLACLGIMSTMFVAILSHLARGNAYFVAPGGVEDANAYESAAMYFALALTILLTGPGVLSVDAAVFGRKNPSVEIAP